MFRAFLPFLKFPQLSGREVIRANGRIEREYQALSGRTGKHVVMRCGSGGCVVPFAFDGFKVGPPSQGSLRQLGSDGQ